MRGQWVQRSPLFNRCSSMPGARLTAALTPRSVFCPSRPASPQAERSALHLVGPQYILVELKWVLHAWSLYPGPWGGAHHKGLSMEPLPALNESLAYPQTSPALMWQLSPPVASQHICTVTGTKDRAGWGAGGPPVGV